MEGHSLRERYYFSIKDIEYSESYEEHFDLFNQGIGLLKNRLNENNFSEFSDEEREVLEEIYTHINIGD